MTQITIHGKRTETIYAFTVHYKGETITGRYIRVSGVDENEPLGLPEEEEKIEVDNPKELTFPGVLSDYGGYKCLTPSQRYAVLLKDIKQAIEDYEKIHRKRTS